jgi:hypothetical protein
MESEKPDKLAATKPPSFDSVSKFLMFGLSLPERTIRSTSAMLSGAVNESAELLLPQAFRSSKSYDMLVKQMLNFLAHDVGGVKREPDAVSAGANLENYVARQTVGGFVDLASRPLLHVSPMTVLALVSDIAYGSQTYLKELTAELKQQGVIDQDSTIDRASDLLAAINVASSKAADAMLAPPLSVTGLAQTIEEVRAAANHDLTHVIPRGEVDRLWREMHELASREGRDVFEISSAMTMFAMNKVGTLGRGALSTITVAGNMFDRHILEHYSQAIVEINTKGFYHVLAESSGPYIEAMWQNFSSDKETLTEDVLSGRLFSRTMKSLGSWFTREAADVTVDETDNAGESTQ